MSDVVIPYRFRVKRDTAANFTSANTLLLQGEFGLETDTGKFKIGDGSTAWNSLNYYCAVPLADPGADRLLFWDDSAGTWKHLTLGAGLTISDTTINASGGASATINAQTGVSYTAQLSDAGNVVTMDNAAANDFIVPPDSSVAFEDGATLEVWQKGAGQTTIVAGTGVTILYDDSLTLALNGQDAGASLRKVAANTWRLIGIMEPASSTTYVQSVVAGTNVTVDNTDPANPVVSASGGGGGYDEGASFPVTPASGDKFYRTDLNLLCFYDGTRWLTVTLYETSVAGGESLPITTSNFQTARFPVRSDFGIYLERWVAATYVATTNNGSNYWTNALQWNTQGNVSTTLASFNTSADTVANNMRHEATVNTVIDSTAVTLGVRVTKTGSPGAIYGLNTLVYRLIVT